MKIRPIAIVLPQFHPIIENDEWWGKGFTEWINVVKGKARFKGHYQPHLPGLLGFYDLRLSESRVAQADLARKFGVYGFCYYHYWFGGRRVLERPVDEMLASGKPDFPFMLCWANENWTRMWDGGSKEVLIEQSYSVDDFVDHARHLVKYFQDPRYIRIGGKPVFAIYKDQTLTDNEEYLAVFRAELLRFGIEVYLCRFERLIGTSRNVSKAYSVFDAGIEFQPLTRQFGRLHPVSCYSGNGILNARRYIRKIEQKLGWAAAPIDDVYRYGDVIDNDLDTDFQSGFSIFPGVCPGWDNSSRRPGSSALIIHGSTPDLFRKWVTGKIDRTNWDLLPDRFLFVNAWNEWAEGNHLEPCERWGTQYLEALRDGISVVAQ